MGMIHHRCCLPLRSNLSVITLVEGNGGRESLKPLNEPQIKMEGDGGDHNFSDTWSLPNRVWWKPEDMFSKGGGLGRQVLVQGNTLTGNN